ncbi:MAG: hypothetical protein AB8G86_21945 [Saprospiraceae bacterium]
MHKLSLLLFCFIFLPLFSFGQLSVGGGASYDTAFERGGLNVQGMYEINKRLRPSFNMVYYISPAGFISTSLSFNTNLHFLILNKEKINVYGLGGLNITRFRLKDSFQKVITTDLGLNIGGGIDFKLSKNLSGIGEVKYDFEDVINRWIISAGVMYRF